MRSIPGARAQLALILDDVEDTITNLLRLARHRLIDRSRWNVGYRNEQLHL